MLETVTQDNMEEKKNLEEQFDNDNINKTCNDNEEKKLLSEEW